jgi:hypothetical protein
MSPKAARGKSANTEAAKKRQTAARKAVAGRRQNAKQRREINTATNRVASELVRFQDHAGDLRSRAEKVIERVKRLVRLVRPARPQLPRAGLV